MTKSISILITAMIFWSAATITSVCAFEMKERLCSDQIAFGADDQDVSIMEQWRANAR